MTMTSMRPPNSSDVPEPTELLIKEAHQNKRRRHLRFAMVTLLVVAVAAIWQANGDGTGAHPAFPLRVHTSDPRPGSPSGSSNLAGLSVLGGQSLLQVVPFGSSTLWVSTMNQVKLTGGGQNIEVTTNAGKTWTNVTPAGLGVTGGAHWINGFFALSPREAWLVYGGLEKGPQVIETTVDAGRHWTQVGVANRRTALPQGGCTLQFVSLRDGTCTNAVGAGGSMPIGIYRTRNGGVSWRKIFHSTPSTTSSVSGSIPFSCDKIVHFQSATKGFALFFCNGGTGAIIYETINGGVTWARCNVTQPSVPIGGGGFTGQPVFSGSLGAVPYVGGNYSAVFVTDNAGRSFHPVYPPGKPRQWAVDLLSPLQWRLTDGKEILKTANGGTTWSTITSDTVLRSNSYVKGTPTGGLVEFTTPDRGWLTENTAKSMLFRTSDGGRTWNVVAVPGV